MFAFEEIMGVYRRLYGDQIYSRQFGSFEAAFRAAWQSFDFISGAETPEEFAEGMTECWQLTDQG